MRRWLLLLAFPVLLVLTVQGLNHVRDGIVALDGKFIGLDGYTHLLRAKQFVETGDWFDHSVPRGNPLAGDVLYWPRPFDALLLGGAVLLLPFTDFDSALHLWAVFIGPVLHLLSLFVLMWAVRPLFDDTGLVYLGILFAFQLFIIHIASLAGPDHHAFLALLFVWLLGAGLRALRTGATSRDMFQAALPATLSLWISLESLVAIAALLAALGATWIAVRADFARRIAVFSVGLTAGFALSLPLEHGLADYTIIVYDAPSVVHLVLLTLTSLADARFGLCRRIGWRGATIAKASSETRHDDDEKPNQARHPVECHRGEGHPQGQAAGRQPTAHGITADRGWQYLREEDAEAVQQCEMAPARRLRRQGVQYDAPAPDRQDRLAQDQQNSQRQPTGCSPCDARGDILEREQTENQIQDAGRKRQLDAEQCRRARPSCSETAQSLSRHGISAPKPGL